MQLFIIYLIKNFKRHYLVKTVLSWYLLSLLRVVNQAIIAFTWSNMDSVQGG